MFDEAHALTPSLGHRRGLPSGHHRRSGKFFLTSLADVVLAGHVVRVVLPNELPFSRRCYASLSVSLIIEKLLKCMGLLLGLGLNIVFWIVDVQFLCPPNLMYSGFDRSYLFLDFPLRAC